MITIKFLPFSKSHFHSLFRLYGYFSCDKNCYRRNRHILGRQLKLKYSKHLGLSVHSCSITTRARYIDEVYLSGGIVRYGSGSGSFQLAPVPLQTTLVPQGFRQAVKTRISLRTLAQVRKVQLSRGP